MEPEYFKSDENGKYKFNVVRPCSTVKENERGSFNQHCTFHDESN